MAALALVAARVGRPVRFLGKKEIFDAPVVGTVARSVGGISVDRGHGSDQPLRAAEAALRAGEVVVVLPQGTIPRGPGVLRYRAQGEDRDGPTGRIDGRGGGPDRVVGDREGLAPVRPDTRLHPACATPRRSRSGSAGRCRFQATDAVADTVTIMTAISDLLPEESKEAHEPTAEELARTKPPS